MEKITELNLSCVDPIVTVEIKKTLVESIIYLNSVSQELDLPYLQIIAGTEADPHNSRVMFTGHKDWLNHYLMHLKKSNTVHFKEDQIGFYINGFGLNSTAYEQILMIKLKESQISILKIIKEAQGILCVLKAQDKAAAVKFFDSLNAGHLT